jgi:DNA-binding Lrp family transcriptional regulator
MNNIKDMAKVKLDKKDTRILEALDADPNINVNRLAKKVGVSRQVAEYRLNRLLLQKTIRAFYTLVDCAKLGYMPFRVHIKLKSVTREQYAEFARKLFDTTPSMWVAFVSGSFDIIYDVFAKNPGEFEKMFSITVDESKELIQGYETLIILNMTLYQYGYFLGGHHNRTKITFNENLASVHVNEKDRKILKAIKSNSRMPYEAIGKQVSLTRNAVKNRIQKLEEEGVIAGYRMFIDFSSLNKDSFKIFIKYNNQKKEQENGLLEYIRRTPGILATVRLFGRWDLDIEIHKENIKTLQEFIMEMRNKFEIIEDYEIVHIIDELGIDWYPGGL